MNLYTMLSKTILSDKIKSHIHKNGFKIGVCNSLGELFHRSMEKPPRVFLIEDDFHAKIKMYDLVKDLRDMFGANPTIIIVGKDGRGDEISHFLDVGIDYYLTLPIDFAVFDDYLYKSMESESCRPFMYRCVPSGGSPLTIEFDIKIQEVSNRGITYSSKNLFLKGAVFEADIENIFPRLSEELLRCRVLQSSKHDDLFQYYAEFIYLNDEQRQKISYEIKNYKH